MYLYGTPLELLTNRKHQSSCRGPTEYNPTRQGFSFVELMRDIAQGGRECETSSNSHSYALAEKYLVVMKRLRKRKHKDTE